jgi:hypothetical protein
VTASVGNGGKPYQILTTSAKLTRLLDGVRSTSCKSAKDRTGEFMPLPASYLIYAARDVRDPRRGDSCSRYLRYQWQVTELFLSHPSLPLFPPLTPQILSRKICWIFFGSTECGSRTRRRILDRSPPLLSPPFDPLPFSPLTSLSLTGRRDLLSIESKDDSCLRSMPRLSLSLAR